MTNTPPISAEAQMARNGADSTTLLEVEKLSVEFQVDGAWLSAVRSVDFSLDRGETLAIVGESGSGKSATVTGIAGLLPRNGRVSAERIELNGRPIDPASKEMSSVRGREIGFVFQDPQSSLNPVLTVERQMTEQLFRHFDISKRQALERAAELLAKVGIPNPHRSLRSYPFEFSGGMRQRISLAMALACSPSLLIADEPTTALDVTVQAQILDLLMELQEEVEIGIIFITHDLSVAALVADRVVVMYAGEIAEMGPKDTLVQSSGHPYTRGLWLSMPSIETAVIPVGISGTPPDLTAIPEGCSFGPRCEWFVPDRCLEAQPLDRVGPEHDVRCCRWGELPL